MRLFKRGNERGWLDSGSVLCRSLFSVLSYFIRAAHVPTRPSQTPSRPRAATTLYLFGVVAIYAFAFVAPRHVSAETTAAGVARSANMCVLVFRC